METWGGGTFLTAAISGNWRSAVDDHRFTGHGSDGEMGSFVRQPEHWLHF